jgi:hypothetical protein
MRYLANSARSSAAAALASPTRLPSLLQESAGVVTRCFRFVVCCDAVVQVCDGAPPGHQRRRAVTGGAGPVRRAGEDGRAAAPPAKRSPVVARHGGARAFAARLKVSQRIGQLWLKGERRIGPIVEDRIRQFDAGDNPTMRSACRIPARFGRCPRRSRLLQRGSALVLPIG